ncbi:MAG: hypothetical protein Q7W51_00905 [Coriobacteriia bacterium]|nr:hypothetical protein [Coriobacteriia bacterium]
MSDADDIAGLEADTVRDPDESNAPVADGAPGPEETDSPDAETGPDADVVAPEEAQPAPAPTPAPAVDSADAALVEAVGGGLTWIPFACYLGLWIVLAGLSAYFLYGASPDQPARWMPEYVPLLWSGVGLTALGPILSVAVWLFARARRPKSARRGLFASAMTRGALVAFFGVAIWVATLFVLEIVAVGGTL